MDRTLLQWLAGIGWTAFTWSLAALLLLNIASAIWFFSRADRSSVQRYTSWWLAGNLLLVTIGVGVPTITAVARLAVMAARAAIPTGNLSPIQTPEVRIPLAD